MDRISESTFSKTVNVPEDYPYADFEDLYVGAWKSGLKGLATYRPNKVLGAVLSVTPAAAERPQDVELPGSDGQANQRLSIKSLPAPVLQSLVWPDRPDLPEGNLAWTYMLEHPQYRAWIEQHPLKVQGLQPLPQ